MQLKPEPTDLARRFTVNPERASRFFIPRTGQYLDRNGRPVIEPQKESMNDRA